MECEIMNSSINKIDNTEHVVDFDVYWKIKTEKEQLEKLIVKMANHIESITKLIKIETIEDVKNADLIIKLNN
jgi:hypothetical protein